MLLLLESYWSANACGLRVQAIGEPAAAPVVKGMAMAGMLDSWQGSLPRSVFPGKAGATTADRVTLLGVTVDRVTRADALQRIEAFIHEGRPRRVATVNLDFLRLASELPVFRQALNEADLVVADGMPLVWAAKLGCSALPERVTGVDLVEAICERGAAQGWSLFLLGGEPGVATAAAAVWNARFPGLRIADPYSPSFGPFTEEEESSICERIREAAPDVLLVALGAPRQDLWLRDKLEALGVPVGIGVGCTLELAGGKARRAPAWMQRSGLEWFFRLTREPGRLGRRYLIADLPVFIRLLCSALRSRRAKRREALQEAPAADGDAGRADGIQARERTASQGAAK